jgi:hypothetical protein
MGPNPGHNRAKVTKNVTIEGSESSTSKVELGCTVVREDRVGMLQECDQDEPVVDPEVWKKVSPEDSYETEVVYRGGDSAEPDHDTNVGQDNLAVVMGHEHRRLGVEVASALRIATLTGSIHENICRPSSKKVGSTSVDSTDGRITKSFPEFLLDLFCDTGAKEVSL